MDVKSLDELRAIREQNRTKVGLRQDSGEGRVLVGMGTCGIAAGARETMNAFVAQLHGNNVKVVPVGCIGNCNLEPLVAVLMPGQEPVTYRKIDKAKAERIVREHITGGKPVTEYATDMNIDWEQM